MAKKSRKRSERDPIREILVMLGLSAEDVRITLDLASKHEISPIQVIQSAIRIYKYQP